MNIVALETESVRTRPPSWQAIVKSAIRDSSQLLRRLDLASDPLSPPVEEQNFPTFVPETWLRRIRPGDPLDPLLLQVLPQSAEDSVVTGFVADAVGDLAAEQAPGLIQKYHGRALLITSGACAIHCRYCFRRHYPYDQAPVSMPQFDEALEVVRKDNQIDEVILSGGDPLMMVDKKLQQLIEMIEAIDHVRRLRIHTSLPSLIPQRVTSDLVSMLKKNRLAKVVVLHINHPHEIDVDVRQAMARLGECHALLLNQAVLLKGVNDDLETLIALSKQLVDNRCQPYYLHQLDRVAGVAHFEVPEADGCKLIEQMRARLPGYAVPRYVRESAGESSKTVIV